jgi:transcriptional regulator with XRE-family HTH domain
MTNLKDRVEELMRVTGWDVPKVASVAKVSRSAVHQWLGGGSKEIKSIGLEPAINLAEATGYRALWLSKGKGERRFGLVIDAQASEAPDASRPPGPTSLSAARDRRAGELVEDISRMMGNMGLVAQARCHSAVRKIYEEDAASGSARASGGVIDLMAYAKAKNAINPDTGAGIRIPARADDDTSKTGDD